MFTDDKMELVYSETGKAVEAMKVLLESIPHGDGENYIPSVELKRANNIWKLFASRHKDKIKPDGFKELLKHEFPDRAQGIEELLG
jgi:hypothetical protein